LLSIKKLFVVSLTLLVVSCANIPIATMLEFRSFDEEKFVELDPNHLLTKIHLDKPAEIKPESTWLTLGVSSSEQEVLSIILRLFQKKHCRPSQDG